MLDADTFALYHVGVPAEERVRVLDVDAPERGAPGFESATAFTAAWLAKGPFFLRACRRDSFGRLLGVVYRGGDTLAVALITNGHGVRP